MSSKTQPVHRAHRKVVLLIGILSLAGLAVLLAFLALAGFLVNFKAFQVAGEAMAPTISNGDKILISKQLGQIQRGDIVVLHYPRDPAYTLIKRVIGLPNESVRIIGGQQLYIDDRLVEEPYLVLQGSASPQKDARSEYKLQPSEYWVMGDNRANSSDSRVGGRCPKT
jgi:signal peptidase I